jgi:hypothetical protein
MDDEDLRDGFGGLCPQGQHRQEDRQADLEQSHEAERMSIMATETISAKVHPHNVVQHGLPSPLLWSILPEIDPKSALPKTL